MPKRAKKSRLNWLKLNRDEKKGTVKKNLMRRLKTFFGKSLHQDFSTLTYIFFETKIL